MTLTFKCFKEIIITIISTTVRIAYPGLFYPTTILLDNVNSGRQVSIGSIIIMTFFKPNIASNSTANETDEYHLGVCKSKDVSI